MFCSTCGKELLNSDKFCGVCINQEQGNTPPVKESFYKQAMSSIGTAYNTVSKSVSDAASSASKSVGEAATSAKNMGDVLAHQIGDLNGDGKIDAEDFKIASDRAKKIASATADEAGKLGKRALESDLAKEAAAGAVVGGVIASVVPVIGTATGAAVGAAVGAFKHVTK